MSSQKTILLPILFGLTFRNYFRTDFLKDILASGARLVCLLPDLDIDDIREEFEPLGVEFFKYPSYKPSFWERRLRELREVQFSKTHDIYALQKKKDQLAQTHYLKYLVNHQLLGPLIPKGPQSFLDNWYWQAHQTRACEELWNRLKPDLLISTNSFFWEELPFFALAHRDQKPVLGVVHSWDSLTTKYKFPYRFTKVAVWNQEMYGEVKKYYPQLLPDTEIVGIAQFDIYKKIESVGKSRDQFLKDLGFDPAYPLVTYSTVPDRISIACHEDVKILLDAVHSDYFKTPLNILVRLHQTGQPSRFKDLQASPYLRIEPPGRMNPKMKDLYNPTQDDVVHFADTLRHSSCVINVASTVSIDAAALDTPVVNIAADFSNPKGTDTAFTRDCYRWEHYAPVVDSGGVDLVKTPQEFLQGIQRALENPQALSAGRQKIRQIFCEPFDGQSASRLAQKALSLLL